jgi:hypothetical protein
MGKGGGWRLGSQGVGVAGGGSQQVLPVATRLARLEAAWHEVSSGLMSKADAGVWRGVGGLCTPFGLSGIIPSQLMCRLAAAI